MGKRESESVGHIQSAYCEGQKEVVTAAHNRCNRFLQREVQRLVKEVEVLMEEHELVQPIRPIRPMRSQ